MRRYACAKTITVIDIHADTGTGVDTGTTEAYRHHMNMEYPHNTKMKINVTMKKQVDNHWVQK